MRFNFILTFFFVLAFSQLAMATDLRPGDVLLAPLDCWSCQLIKDQENTPYSHSGLVLRVTPEVFIAEAIGEESEAVTLEEFMNRVSSRTSVLVLRPVEFEKAAANSTGFWKSLSTQLWNTYLQKFRGAPFDHEFLWENQTPSGQEALYCSELIVKVLNAFLKNKIQPSPMKFDVNRRGWFQYFQGHIPDGEPGVSPGTLERAPQLRPIGRIPGQRAHVF